MASRKFRINREALAYFDKNSRDWLTPKIMNYEDLKGLTVKHAFKLIMTQYQEHSQDVKTIQFAYLLSTLDYFYFNVRID